MNMGGGSGGGVDEDYNARMASIFEEQQGWARGLMNFWEHGVNYDPNEKVMVDAQGNIIVPEAETPASNTSGQDNQTSPGYNPNRGDSGIDSGDDGAPSGDGAPSADAGGTADADGDGIGIRSVGNGVTLNPTVNKSRNGNVSIMGDTPEGGALTPADQNGPREMTLGEFHGYNPDDYVSEMDLMQEYNRHAMDASDYAKNTKQIRTDVMADNQIATDATRRSLARMGISPTSGRGAEMLRTDQSDLAKQLITARSKARDRSLSILSGGGTEM